ncbi:MAG: hypothetical protein Q8Q04_01895 [archaeon]|nr:hypothetical protein [archaeon]
MKNEKKLEKMSAVIFGLLIIGSVLGSASFASADLLGGINANGNVGIGVNSNSAANANANSNINLGVDSEEDDSEDSFSVNSNVKSLENSLDVDAKASSLIYVMQGEGWVISSENGGDFMRIVLVEGSYVRTEDYEEFDLAKGKLKIGTNPTMGLTLTSKNDGKITFDVNMEGKNKVEGILELSEMASLTGFSIWKGTLKLDSGESYELTFATKNSEVKEGKKVESGNEDVEAEGDADLETEASAKNGKSGSEGNFWSKVKVFFGFEKR